MVNKVILIGNVGQDPVTRVLENNNQVTSISIATSKNWKDRVSGEKKTETQWHNLVLWNGLSKVAEQYIKKGSKIYVEGELVHRSYNDNDNVKRWVTEVIVKELKMLSESANANSSASIPPPPLGNSNNDEEDDDLPF